MKYSITTIAAVITLFTNSASAKKTGDEDIIRNLIAKQKAMEDKFNAFNAKFDAQEAKIKEQDAEIVKLKAQQGVPQGKNLRHKLREEDDLEGIESQGYLYNVLLQKLEALEAIATCVGYEPNYLTGPSVCTFGGPGIDNVLIQSNEDITLGSPGDVTIASTAGNVDIGAPNGQASLGASGGVTLNSPNSGISITPGGVNIGSGGTVSIGSGTGISLSALSLTANFGSASINGGGSLSLIAGGQSLSLNPGVVNLSGSSLTTSFVVSASIGSAGPITIGSSGAPISVNGVTFPFNPNAVLVSSTDDVDLGEYSYNATEYEYNVTDYEYKATDYEYNVTEYVYEYEDNGIMQKLNAAGIGN